jgi:hypothetical protein
MTDRLTRLRALETVLRTQVRAGITMLDKGWRRETLRLFELLDLERRAFQGDLAAARRGYPEVPPMVHVAHNLAEMSGGRVETMGYDVYSWSPCKAGEGVPSSQVHVHFAIRPGMTIVLRLKSARALDEIVAVLLQHRADVWGKGAQG